MSTTTRTATGTALTADLWATGRPVFDAILAHPFVTGLTTGDLDEDVFAFYVVQDAHYLRAYARALSVLAARAPDAASTSLFASHAAGALAVERELHEGLLRDLGLDDPGRQGPPTPTTVAYTSYLLATTQSEPFVQGLGAVLPCYWIYWEVGRALAGRSSPVPLYQRWIETYGGEQFGEIVRPVLELTDRVGEDVPAAERARMAEHYLTASRYEWMFWDAAYRREGWPV